MSKVPANTFLLLRKLQAYSVGAENVRAQVAVAAEKNNAAVDSSSGFAEQKNGVDKEMPLALAGKKEENWMRDPKTGNWMPENHISEVDAAAELRDKFLPPKQS